MKIAVQQPRYMPEAAYFHAMAGADLFVFLNDVQFEKNGLQNRNKIRNAESWQWLTLPVVHKFLQKLGEVEVDFTKNWQRNHLHSLDACYGTAPFYRTYVPLFAEFFCAPASRLDRICIDSVRLLAGIMGIKTETVLTSDYRFRGQSTERLIAVCRHFKADTYLAAPGEDEYVDLPLVEKAGVKVKVLDAASTPYPQHRSRGQHDFVAGLSAIDLVFNCGPKSLEIIAGAQS
jgi:hypothetical protein